MAYLTAFFEFFRFIKHYHERAERRLALEAEERERDRAHQRAMLETIFGRMLDSNKVQHETFLALADAQKAQANVMQTWIDGFRVADTSPAPPSTVDDEKAWLKEQLRLGEVGLGDLDPGNLPPEFQLAYELAKAGSNPITAAALGEDFDREGSDF
jgi:hypothetical protein